MDTALPAGTENNISNGKDHAESTADFKNVVEQSKIKMHAENSPPLKRGRGRPRKVTMSDGPAPSTSLPPPSMASAQAPPDISPYLTGPIMIASKIPAHKYGIPELAFTIDEAGICALSCNNLLNVFIPDIGRMNPKTAAVISAFSTFGAIGFQKYQIYLIKMKEKREKENSPTPEKTAENPFPVTHINNEPYRTRP